MSFNSGDEVEIIGPDTVNCNTHLGKKFIVTHNQQWTYSAPCLPWYPESSLRLVEDLKVGDWIEIIGPAEGSSTDEMGHICRVKHILSNGHMAGFPAPNSEDFRTFFYPPSSLKKLTSEEITHYQKDKLTTKIHVDTPRIIECIDIKLWQKKIEQRIAIIEKHIEKSNDTPRIPRRN